VNLVRAPGQKLSVLEGALLVDVLVVDVEIVLEADEVGFDEVVEDVLTVEDDLTVVDEVLVPGKHCE
jgi:hypothetical protein